MIPHTPWSSDDGRVILRPPWGTSDKGAWLKRNAIFTRHIGWQHYETWAIFNRIVRRGWTLTGWPFIVIDTEAGEFLVRGTAGESLTDDLAGQRLYFTWWRGETAKIIGDPPKVLTPPRAEPLPEGWTWTEFDYVQRLRRFPYSAGVPRFYTPRQWFELPERRKFGCPK